MGLQLSPPPPLPPPYLPALIIVTIVISTLTHVLHYALPPLLTAPSSRHQTSCKLSRVVASWRSSVSRRALAGVPRLARLSVGWVLAGRIILVYPHRLIISFGLQVRVYQLGLSCLVRSSRAVGGRRCHCGLLGGVAAIARLAGWGGGGDAVPASGTGCGPRSACGVCVSPPAGMVMAWLRFSSLFIPSFIHCPFIVILVLHFAFRRWSLCRGGWWFWLGARRRHSSRERNGL
jgi:hypothetical protein